MKKSREILRQPAILLHATFFLTCLEGFFKMCTILLCKCLSETKTAFKVLHFIAFLSQLSTYNEQK